MLKNKIFGTTLGIVIIILAIIYVGNVCEVWQLAPFFDGWWTLFIIVPSAVLLLERGKQPIYIVFLVIGIAALISQLSAVPEIIRKLMFPAVVIGFGFALIYRKKLGMGESYIAVFGGRVPELAGRHFDGAVAISLFGGVTVKLGEALIDSDCTIFAVALFGGVDIKVPNDINVTVSGLPIFGGIGEPKNRKHIEGVPTLHVDAICAFGGVDVKTANK